jgi:AMIN domain
MHKGLIFWSKRLLGVGLLGLYTAFTTAVSPTLAQENRPINITATTRLEGWRFSPQAMQLDIALSADSQPRYFYLPKPARIVVDLPNTRLGRSISTQENYSGAVQRVRVSQLNGSVARIVMDLAPGTFIDGNQIQLQPASWQNQTRWMLRAFFGGGNSSFQQPAFQQPLSPAQQVNPNSSFFNNVNNIQPPSPPPGYLGTPQPPYVPPQSQSNFSRDTQNSGNFIPPQPRNGMMMPQPSTVPSPTVFNDSSQPSVIVPPLNQNLPYQVPNSPLPPASFPNQPGFNSITPFPTPNFQQVPVIVNPQPVNQQPLPIMVSPQQVNPQQVNPQQYSPNPAIIPWGENIPRR